MDEKEQQKHDVALYVEWSLYPVIREIYDDDSIGNEEKLKQRNEEIEKTIQVINKNYKLLTNDEIREQIVFALDRTIKNMKELRKMQGKCEDR